MAKLYAAADGTIVRLLKSEQDERMFPDAPPNTTVLEFDSDTNADVLRGLDIDWDSHRVIDGQLTRNGQAVTLAPPGQDYQDRTQRTTLITEINSDRTALAAGPGNLTTGQGLARLETMLQRLQTAFLLVVRLMIRRGN
ncbi:MAG TPA: hypothetical protein VLA19_29830 [Herpetosiphonaceae bacterium]|nr:hypothetical protein [Herpetosiphonaceae bacterium]